MTTQITRNNNINHSRMLELFWEFEAKAEELSTLYLDSIAGYSILYDRILAKQSDLKKILGDHEYATATFQDSLSVAYKNICKKDYQPISTSPLMKQGDMKKRICENGKNYLLMGNLCVIAAYSYWEEYLRIEIGIAIGALKGGAVNSEETREILNKHVKSDFWGDMGLLRNSIIHNKGIATSKMSKCKVIKYFKPGQKIELDYGRMYSIFLVMWSLMNSLFSMSLPSQKGFKIPVAQTT